MNRSTRAGLARGRHSPLDTPLFYTCFGMIGEPRLGRDQADHQEIVTQQVDLDQDGENGEQDQHEQVEGIYKRIGFLRKQALPSCTVLHDEPSGRIAIYYGGADTVTALAFCKMDEVLEWVKENSMV